MGRGPEARKIQNESLKQSLEQKSKLLELAQSVQDERISKEIADKLCLSVRTVENHRRSLYQKLGVGNSAEHYKNHRTIPSVTASGIFIIQHNRLRNSESSRLLFNKSCAGCMDRATSSPSFR